MFEYANQWTDRHLSSCKSYRVNNHFRRRMKKWDDNYSRVFGCDANSTPASLLATAPSSAPPSTAPPSTAITAPELECGCYAENEEIAIENNKCILDLGTAPDVSGTWTLTYEFKFNSVSDDPRNLFYMVSGIGF